MNSLVGRDIVIVRNLRTPDFLKNNDHYFEKVYDRMCKIVDVEDNGTIYLTNFYVREFKSECNDYVHYGFLKVMDHDFRLVKG